MNLVRALIVDDEVPVRRYLAELLHGTGRVDPVAVVGTVADATQAMRANLDIEAAFVDIRLIDRAGDRSGLSWVQGVLAGPEPPLVVLATALVDHAVAAFDVGAVDYLLKPFTRSRVALCVDRLMARRAPRPVTPPSRLMARDGANLVFLPVSGILAFEASDRLAFVHHLEGRFMIDLSLAAAEAQLAGHILRTHRNWLVMMDKVRELNRSSGELALMVGPELAVPVSRDRAPAVREALLSRTLGTRR
jgi:DNA-binding LytR/AlgR family response regulator